MRRKSAPISEEAHTARFAWWAAFLTTVVLMVGLTIVRSAAALPSPGLVGAIPPVLESEPEEEEPGEELETEECEVDEETEEEECEAPESVGSAPPECLLASADAAVTANTDSDRLRLAVRYTAPSPVTVAVDYWLRGSKGPLGLDGDRGHFATAGVFHLTQGLSKGQQTKVSAAKSFTVELRPLDAPRYCNSFFDLHLTARHATHGGLVWVEPGTSFRPLPRP
jgi:hypothetical protein